MNRYIIYYCREGCKVFTEIRAVDEKVANSVAYKLNDVGSFGVIGLATDKLRGIYL